jgi:hypothetical protein
MWLDDPDTPDQNPPFSETLVEEVERILNVKLPRPYVELMRQRNGGFLEPQLVSVKAFIAEEFEGHVSDGYISVSAIAGLNPAADADGSLTQSAYMIQEWDLPDGLVLLDGDGHTWIALDYRIKKENPPVVFALAGHPECLPLAENFSEFLQCLVPYEDVYDLDGNLRA